MSLKSGIRLKSNISIVLYDWRALYIYLFVYYQLTNIKEQEENNQTQRLNNNKIENLGVNIVKVAWDLHVNAKKVASVLRLYRATGNIGNQKQKGHEKTIVFAEISLFIERQFERNKSLTLKMIKHTIYDNLHLNVRIFTIHLH